MTPLPDDARHIPFAEAYRVSTDEDIVCLSLSFLPPEGHTWRITQAQARQVARELLAAADHAGAWRP